MIGESQTKNLIVNRKITSSLLIILAILTFSIIFFSSDSTIQAQETKNTDRSQVAIVGPPGGEDVQKVKEKASETNSLFSSEFQSIKNKIYSALSPFFQKVETKIEKNWSNSLRPWFESHWQGLITFLNKDIIIR